ncbi:MULTISPECIES: energy transducer TonB [Niastella]|uniref:Energy transducer TonB n=1 Tax=Niastella soli TaxID=2821487 RepID=A0ABS3YRR4_9BACT|nr:energy transducer TonB [Niastella soli]MBO9200473.1 energy transducer TonB [Niastella soli]
MKPTALLIAVMLILGEMLFIGCSFDTKKKTEITTQEGKLLLPEVSGNEMKITPLPQPDHKETTSEKTVKIKRVKPFTGTIKGEKNRTPYSEPLPIQEEDYRDSIIWSKVEIEAEYPGGAAAWLRFWNRNLHIPQDVIDNESYGSVVVQFVVDKEGNVSDVEALSGAEAMCTEVVRVIKKSGRWTPAIQNGRYVKSLKKQPFIICIKAEE